MKHKPVLLNEVIELFNYKMDCFVDATLGAGGHSEALLKAHPEMQLIGIDQDPTARALAKERLPGATILAGNFRNLKDLIKEPVDGILMDIGVSSMQLDTPDRGFAFSKDAPLDMRMDPENPLTAHEIINEWPEEQIGEILRTYGEIHNWRRVASQIVHSRPLETTLELVEALKGTLRTKPGIHPATLVFQALRIAVNDELGAITQGLHAAIDLLNPGGRVAVITFHSLEDRIVKNIFRDEARGWEEDSSNPLTGRKKREKRIRIVTPKPTTPSREETRENPRSRSSKLRATEKI